jgi:hypothetical protein
VLLSQIRGNSVIYMFLFSCCISVWLLAQAQEHVAKPLVSSTLSIVTLPFYAFPDKLLSFAGFCNPLVGFSILILEVSRSHSDTPQSVGLLWTSDQPVAETYLPHNTTLTTDKHPCSRRVSNP